MVVLTSYSQFYVSSCKNHWRFFRSSTILIYDCGDDYCRFQYGRLQTVGLTLPDQYELVDNLVAYNRPWKTLPVDDIIVKPPHVESREAGDDGSKQSALLGQLCLIPIHDSFL